MERQRVTEDMIQQILSLRREGKTYYQIARIVGLNAKSCRKHCVQRGIDDGRDMSCRKYTDEEKDDIACLYRDGWTPTQIANKYGRKTANIQNLLRRMGVETHTAIKARLEHERITENNVTELPYVLKDDPKPIKRCVYGGKKYIDVSEVYGL